MISHAVKQKLAALPADSFVIEVVEPADKDGETFFAYWIDWRGARGQIFHTDLEAFRLRHLQRFPDGEVVTA